MGIAGPHSGDKIASVFSLAEITAPHAFFVDRISFLDLYARVNDRDETDMLLFHLADKIREILKFTAQRKILIRIHIIDIHVNHIKGNMVFPMTCRYPAEVFFCFILPAALSEAKCEFRRDIAPADHAAELLYNIIRRIPADNVQV